MTSYDIAVIGPSHSGKTTLIHSYLFNDQKAIMSSYSSSKTVTLYNKKYVLRIYDEVGEAKLLIEGPLAMSLQKRKAVLVCFSVYDRKSFEEAGDYIKLALLNGPRNAFFMLVGTHCDVKGNKEKSFYAKDEVKTTEGKEEKTRQISSDEAEAFASNLKWPYIETNAREDMKVEEAFERVLKEMLLRFPPVKPKSPDNPPRQLPDDDKSCSIF